MQLGGFPRVHVMLLQARFDYKARKRWELEQAQKKAMSLHHRQMERATNRRACHMMALPSTSPSSPMQLSNRCTGLSTETGCGDDAGRTMLGRYAQYLCKRFRTLCAASAQVPDGGAAGGDNGGAGAAGSRGGRRAEPGAQLDPGALRAGAGVRADQRAAAGAGGRHERRRQPAHAGALCAPAAWTLCWSESSHVVQISQAKWLWLTCMGSTGLL